LFTYVILSPFLPQEKLEKIFGKNLLKDNSLKTIMDELDGKAAVKPFECVGTPDEVNAALWESVDTKKVNMQIPLVQNVVLPESRPDKETFQKLIRHLNQEHFLSEKFFQIIKKAIDNVTV